MTDITNRSVSLPELEAYCDGALSDEDASEVTAALERDPELRRQFRDICNAGARLEKASSVGDDDPALNVLVGKLERQLQAKRRVDYAKYTSATAAILAAVGVGGWYTAQPNETPSFELATAVAPIPVPGAATPVFVEDAAGAHSIFAFDEVHPVEFTSTSKETMSAWFISHIGRGASVPDLGHLGFNLVGGRLLGDADGAMAQVLYENEAGDRVSLVYGKRAVPGGSEVRLVKIGKNLASYWQSDDLAWAVVEDAPGADVSAIATYVADIVGESQ